MEKGIRGLLFRFVDNLYSTDDAHRVWKAVQSPENKKALDDVAKQVWEEAEDRTTLTGTDFERYRGEGYSLLQRICGHRRTMAWRVAKAAACVVAICCLLYIGSRIWRYVDQKSVVYQEIVTSFGEKREVTLADGTTLVLNSCSRIKVPDSFTGDERRIRLDGEAYFRVSRNENQPFIIETSRFQIRVLGTSFNVKSYGRDELVSVDVESGRVQVDTPEAMMRLKANERILINTVTGNYSKSDEQKEVAQWRNGTLRFDETPIRDVAKELERIYHCVITFEPGQTFDNLISGEHDNQSLESVLFSIEYASGIHYKKEGNRIRMYK